VKEKQKLYTLYLSLMEKYGVQGWWPLISDGPEYDAVYCPGDYRFPKKRDEVFEICLGAILGQNTTFTSVVKALGNLKALNALSPEGFKALDENTLKTAIRPVGYFNQKARYSLAFLDFFSSLKGDVPTRKALLAVVGVGEETADSMLLYAYGQPEFVVDAYTKRILFALGFIEEKAKYHSVKMLMQEALLEGVIPKEERVKVYQEYHALLVAHAKEHYSKKPYGKGCDLREILA